MQGTELQTYVSSQDQLLIVSYLYDGHMLATRHAPNCGLLRRTQETIEGGGDWRFPGLSVWEPWLYNLRPGAEARPPKDHSCVERWLLAETNRTWQEALAC